MEIEKKKEERKKINPEPVTIATCPLNRAGAVFPEVGIEVVNEMRDKESERWDWSESKRELADIVYSRDGKM